MTLNTIILEKINASAVFELLILKQNTVIRYTTVAIMEDIKLIAKSSEKVLLQLFSSLLIEQLLLHHKKGFLAQLPC